MNTARDILGRAGLNSIERELAIPYAVVIAGAASPRAQGIMALVRAAQRRLRLPATGLIDQATRASLNVTVPGWLNESWLTILERLRTTPARGGIPVSGLGEFDVTAKNVAIAVAVGIGALLYFGSKGPLGR